MPFGIPVAMLMLQRAARSSSHLLGRERNNSRASAAVPAAALLLLPGYRVTPCSQEESWAAVKGSKQVGFKRQQRNTAAHATAPSLLLSLALLAQGWLLM